MPPRSRGGALVARRALERRERRRAAAGRRAPRAAPPRPRRARVRSSSGGTGRASMKRGDQAAAARARTRAPRARRRSRPPPRSPRARPRGRSRAGRCPCRAAARRIAAGEPHAVVAVRDPAVERHGLRLGGSELRLQRAQGVLDHSGASLPETGRRALASGPRAGSLPCCRGGFRAGADGDDPRGDGRAPRHRDPARAARPGRRGCRPSASSPTSSGSPLDAAPGADVADRERPPGGHARPRRRHVRVRRAAAGGERRVELRATATGASCSTTGSRSRSAPPCSPPSAPAGRPRAAARARRDDARRRDFSVYRRADVFFHLGLAEAARSARLVAAMTEVQGEMSELIAHIAHPAPVLVALERASTRAGDGARARRRRAAAQLVREHLKGTEQVLAA